MAARWRALPSECAQQPPGGDRVEAHERVAAAGRDDLGRAERHGVHLRRVTQHVGAGGGAVRPDARGLIIGRRGDDGVVKLAALDVQLYSNGGAFLDLSGPVMDRALLHIDNVYKWPSFRARGVVCKTHTPPNTAFRGFGGPQVP